MEAADLRLNLTEAGRAAAVSRHLGDGNTPVLGQEGLQVWSLVQEDYVSAYSRDHHMPLWAAFTLDEKVGDINNKKHSSRRQYEGHNTPLGHHKDQCHHTMQGHGQYNGPLVYCGLNNASYFCTTQLYSCLCNYNAIVFIS